MAANKVTIELYVDDKGTVHVKKFAGETKKGFKQIGDQAKKTGDTLKKLGAAALGFFAITKIKSAITDFIQLAGKQEDAVATLEQAMRNAGTYRKEDLEGLKAYASQLQEVTRFGDEATLATMANLQGYGMEIAMIKEATKATQDLAAAKKMDLFAASELIGKAFVGETQTLSRYGIILDEGIPKGEKFAAVLKLIGERYGGQAEALASTKYGGLVQLGNLLGDAKEDIGKLAMAIADPLLPALKSWAGALKEIANYWTKAISGPGVDLGAEMLEDYRKRAIAIKEELLSLKGGLKTPNWVEFMYGGLDQVHERAKTLYQELAQLEAKIAFLTQPKAQEPGGTPGGPKKPKEPLYTIEDYYKDQLEEWKQVTADFYAMKEAREKADLAQHKATLDEWGQVTKDFYEAEQAQWEQETEAYLALEEIKAQAHQEELARYEEVMKANEDYMKQYAANEKAKAAAAFQTNLNMISYQKQAFAELAKGSKMAFGLYKAFSISETLMKTYEAAQKSFAWASTWGGPPAGAVAAAIAMAAGMARVAAITSLEPAALYHEGGIVDRGSRPSRLVSPDVFAGAQRAHQGLGPGERGVIVKEKEGIFTEKQMAALGMGGTGELELHLHNHLYMDGREQTKTMIHKIEVDGILLNRLRRALS